MTAGASQSVHRTVSNPLLQMRNITKRFGAFHALNGVNLDVYEGEIHALMGENGAGKSTLMKVLSGAHKASSGEVRVDSKPVTILGPAHASALGISIIYQELALSPNLTVAENMLLGRERSVMGVLNRGAMQRACESVLRDLAVDFDTGDKVASLSLAQRQQVEIAKALLSNCRILVMDEPTTSLSSTECDRLFHLIRRLRDQGLAIIYISHRMSEIYELSDRVTVLRDGSDVGSIERCELSEERLVQMMVGRDLSSFYQKVRNVSYTPGLRTLEVKGMSDGRKVRGVSLDLHAGEILGLAGIVGAGRTELARLIYGADRKTDGEVILEGRSLSIRGPLDAIAAGIVYLTEDRKAQGLFLDMSVSKNINIGVLDEDSHGWGILSADKAAERTRAAILDMKIAVASPEVNVGSLSGGNQQKVLLARLLQTDPKVLILDEPTRGVDIGAKSEIYRIIEALAARGTSVLVISSELPELVGMCDRIVVMREGIIAGEVGGSTGIAIDSEAIIAIATGSNKRQ
ncbi:UNVERIFIED_ORG: ribose transport system ATP-binding protein [Agrobacterium larrymoorei]|uniref:Sugar ABC transporter ATP-binding protein n=1 Tax=Agrobacterium cavarae TaxID=2528239 RepID=A0ABY1YD68_9HYPH|nr:sugar ABC transporter ATP-binding protein [Agrobacterium cavarae]MDP9573994.1 ribose transport system ATP-binding protein [Agrobacterium larrymoorei]TBN18465.1 sugar ABC transporter ATP-binding protein [Agrobacterium cavarae]